MKNDKIKKIYSCCGSKFRREYIRLNDENGFPIMKVNNIVNQYEEIQSYKDDNNIERILERLGGDISKLDTNKGVYIDVTSLPDNYNTFMNNLNLIADDYSKLPVKYKEKLKNNYNLFFGLAMNGKLKDFINDIDNSEKYINNINFDFGGKNESPKEDKEKV